MDIQADLPRIQAGKPGKNGLIGGRGQRIDRDSEEKMAHGGIPGDHRLVDGVGRNPVAVKQPAGHLVEAFKDEVPELGRILFFFQSEGEAGR
jgi:hypothetical protein